jgi:hypothetical protein
MVSGNSSWTEMETSASWAAVLRVWVKKVHRLSKEHQLVSFLTTLMVSLIS